MAERVIVVGVDGSPASAAAARWAADEADARGVRLRAVYAYPRPAIFHPVAPELYGEVEAAARRQARNWIVEALGEERARDVEVDVAPGEPGPALIAAAGQAELLVIGAAEHYRHGYRAAPKIARYCLGRSRAPIVLVPTSGRPRVADPV